MLPAQARKNKVVLSDYNYRRDIVNRLFMAELTVFEVNVIQEILHSSLKFTIKHLAEAIDASEKEVLAAIDKLSKIKLVQRQGDVVHVDKELRKYYESQIIKFDDDFEPGMEFLQGLLSKVPIHVLPTWYSIPRSSDNIFASILEKNLLTPKVYERYLQEINFDIPMLNSISEDVLRAPDFKIRSKSLIEKYSLSREQFEEYMLLLEYNLVCCLSYNRVNDLWEEVVTPFHEWREYLRVLRDSTPAPIKDVVNIQRNHPHDFGFAHDLSKILQTIQKEPLAITKLLKKQLLPNAPTEEEYLDNLINKMTALSLAEMRANKLSPLPGAATWLKKNLQEQASFLYRQPLTDISYADRDVREIEKGLKKVIHSGWIYLDDFINSLTAPLGNAEPVTLINKGKRWKYTIPSYSDETKNLVTRTICERLFEAGLIAIGSHKKKICFCVTPFGRMTFGE